MTATTKVTSPWAPLRHPIFFALFVAQLASNIGTLMQNVGSAWLMGDLGASTAVVALVQTATFLPVLIVGIPAGALADIVDRRRLILSTQAWMMVWAFLLAALTFAHHVTPMLLLLLTFALGIGTALNGPAWQAIQSDLVPEADIPQAFALGALAYNVGRAAGPALGGLVVAAAGPQWVFLLNAVSFVGVMLVVRAWKSPRRSSRLPLESLSGATRACLRYGANAPLLRGILLRTAAFILPASALQALLPTVVRDDLHLGSGGYGALLACFGIGAASSAIIRPRLIHRFSADALMACATCVLAATLAVTAFVHISVIVGITLFVGGSGWTMATTTANVAAQAALPWWVRARGLGLYLLVITGGIAIGSGMWGYLAEWSLQGALTIAAAGELVLLFGTRRWKLGHVEGLDLTPLPGTDPVVTLMPQPTDGPVVVTITYLVAEDDMADFVVAMRKVEAHRRRTGAYQWGLFRDLAAPDRFVEMFHVGSWAEHLRQHQRMTATSDASLAVVVRFMHSSAAVAHLLSAYSAGALDRLEPHSEPDEMVSEDRC